MTTTNVEIIDLTNSPPQSPALSAASEPPHTRSLRPRKRPTTPMVISESSEDVPLTKGSPDLAKRRKTRKETKKRSKQSGKEEVPRASNGKGESGLNGPYLNANGRAKCQGAARSNSRSPAETAATQHSSRTPLFYLDDKPDAPAEECPKTGDTADSVAPANHAKVDDLLLPDHVIFDIGRTNGVLDAAEASAAVESDIDDFILYADAELNVFTRYYEEPKDDSERKAHLVCGQCGAEGDHKQVDCPVIVCLTCGAHNEHSTRQCPIVKTCFACGSKGHIRDDCPNKHEVHRMIDRGYDCGRCGSYLHKARECPTLWRMYEYIDEAEREHTLKSRKEKENLPIGRGGEGYIGEDYWCYNCGGEGHLGDDCVMEPQHRDSKEPSAFGSFNTMSGPFAEYHSSVTTNRKLRREWEIDGNFDDGHGFAGPSDVGRRGRDKERERMRRRETESRDIDDDRDDWFRSRLQSTSRSNPNKTSGKINSGSRGGNKADKTGSRPADRLLDRISSEHAGGPERSGERRRHDRERTPRDSRDADYHGSNNRSRRDRKGESERERRRGQGRERDREQASYREDPILADRKRSGDRSHRQYFGSYSR